MVRTLSVERKKELWQEKVDYIGELDLSQEELDYLKWFQEVFKTFDYSKGKNTPKELEEEMYDRLIAGMEKFEWSRDFVYQTFFVIGDVDLADPIIPNEKQMTPPIPDCDCRYYVGCPIWSQCIGGGCTRVTDCGMFGNSDCKGTCE